MLEPIGKREISKVSPKTSQQNRLAVQSILSLAKSFGIDSKRILFAPRVEKWDHVLRCVRCSIFQRITHLTNA